MVLLLLSSPISHAPKMNVSFGQGEMAILIFWSIDMKYKLKILYEDNHIIVIEKQPGVLSQPDTTGAPNLVDMVKEYLRIKYEKPGEAYVGLVQRLDRPVGGVMVLAKTSKAFIRLQDQMKARTIKKHYLAVSGFAPPKNEDELKHFLLKHESINRTSVYEEPLEGAKDSRLKYKLLGTHEGRYIFDIQLITGRSHQIRSQMAHIGCPLLGDVKYGNNLTKLGYFLALYAYSLSFDHPTLKERMTFLNYPKSKEYWTGLDIFFPKENSDH